MRTLIAAGVLAAGLAAHADDPKPQAPTPATKVAPRPKKAEPTLKVGDKAPAFKADKFLQGAEVTQFEPGKVYVVEFWATWCGPCIVMMPHLADLADEYKDKGVTVIGYSAKDPNNDREKVEKFVQKRGPKLGYTFAYGDDRETYNAWMRAAGQGGIPCSFVVGKDGTIAFIGHPMHLDTVLPQVVAGTWDPAKGKAELAAAEKGFEAAFAAGRAKDPADGLKTLADLTAKQPGLADNPYLTGPRLGLMLKAKQFAEAEALAGKLVAKAAKRDDTVALATVANTLVAAKDRPELTKLALSAADATLSAAGEDNLSALMTAHATYTAAGQADKAKGFATKAVGVAEKAVKDDKDWQGNLRLAGVYKAAGEADKAKAAAQKAVDAAPEQAKQYVGQQAKQYGAKPKDD
jgi:thiol-disulfide isomerase/thioredoxin/uncharacterized protein YjbJ (UPF0337 family)